MTITTDAPAVPAVPVATPLDEAREFLSWFIDASDTQLDVMAAWAAHTHVLSCFYTTGRLLFHSQEPECGKTEAESLVLRMSANPWPLNKETTKDGLRVKFDVADPRMVPTIGIQEVTEIFGESGRRGSSHPANTYLRLGYKNGEAIGVSRNGANVDIPIYHAAVMAGLRNAVPKDIRSRCICIKMKQGSPAMDYEGREHDPMTEALGVALGNYYRRRADEVGRFRARGLHPKLKGRKREIWEAVFAIAKVTGGTWPRRMMAAFLDLAIDQADSVPLTPQQTILSGMLDAADEIGRPRVAGADLIEEMRRSGVRMYDGLTDRSLAMFMAKAMEPVQPSQFRTDDGRVVRGYLLADVRKIAAERLPAETEDDEPDAPQDSGRTIFSVPDDEAGHDLDEVVTENAPLTCGVTTVTDAAGRAAPADDEAGDDDLAGVDTSGMDTLV